VISTDKDWYRFTSTPCIAASLPRIGRTNGKRCNSSVAYLDARLETQRENGLPVHSATKHSVSPVLVVLRELPPESWRCERATYVDRRCAPGRIRPI
jgi:hypothetical protein